MNKIECISDLVKELEKIRDTQGELPVFINDADTRGFGRQGYNLKIQEVLVFEENGNIPKRVLIGGDYYD